jgi:hypothetical protein
MRDYPVTEVELDELFRVGIFASVCFFGGTACLGFAITLFKDLALAQGVPADVSIFWQTIRWVSLVAGVMFYVAGAVSFYRNSNHISRIKRETTFDD